jgi:hypothetical protein
MIAIGFHNYAERRGADIHLTPARLFENTAHCKERSRSHGGQHAFKKRPAVSEVNKIDSESKAIGLHIVTLRHD